MKSTRVIPKNHFRHDHCKSLLTTVNNTSVGNKWTRTKRDRSQVLNMTFGIHPSTTCVQIVALGGGCEQCLRPQAGDLSDGTNTRATLFVAEPPGGVASRTELPAPDDYITEG